MMSKIGSVLASAAREWNPGVLAWAACAICILMSSLLIGVSALSCLTALREVGKLKRQSPAASVAVVDTPDETSDFVSMLPLEATSTQLAKTMYRASTGKAIHLLSLQWQQEPGASEALDRLQMNVVLRGNYIATKELLAELTDRHPNVSLHRFRMSRPSQSLETDTSATLTLWTRSSLTDRHVPR